MVSSVLGAISELELDMVSGGVRGGGEVVGGGGDLWSGRDG